MGALSALPACQRSRRAAEPERRPTEAILHLVVDVDETLRGIVGHGCGAAPLAGTTVPIGPLVSIHFPFSS